MTLFTDSDRVKIDIGGVPINNYSSYTFENDFFVAYNTFHLTLEDEDVQQLLAINKDRRQLINVSGLPIHFFINDILQFTGFVISSTLSNSRTGGTKIDIIAEDQIGLAKDSTLYPGLNFTPQDTYQSIMQTVFAPFGFENADQFEFDSDRLLLSSQASNTPKEPKFGGTATRKGHRASRKPASSQLNRQLKPYTNEGVMEFVERFTKRVGWCVKLFPNVDPEKSVISFTAPNYTEDNFYQGCFLFRPTADPFSEGRTVYSQQYARILTGTLNINWSHQASVLVAEGSFSGTGLFSRNDVKVAMVNEISGYKYGLTTSQLAGSIEDRFLSSVVDVLDTWVPSSSNSIIFNPNVLLYQQLMQNNLIAPDPNPFARPVFIYDQESGSVEELTFLLRRKMYDLQNSFLNLNYTVSNHSINGVIWQPNTMVQVLDGALGSGGNGSEGDITSLQGNFWIRRVSFTRSRTEGTKTHLHISLPNIYDFEIGDEQ